MRIDGKAFVAAALKHGGKPYIWGAVGPDAFDCSGLVKRLVWELGGPDWRGGPPWYNADRLFHALDAYLVEVKQIGEVRVPVPVEAGTLVFYGPPGRADHVMIAVGEGRVFGACGGGPATLTQQRGAAVQYRGALRYRPDLLGLRRLPEVESIRPGAGGKA